MTITSSEILFKYSGSGTGSTSIGGTLGSAITDNAAQNIFDNIPESHDFTSAYSDYRCIYIQNGDSQGGTMKDVSVWCNTITGSSGITARFAPAAQAKNTATTALASKTTAPTGITWSTAANTTPANRASAAKLGDFTSQNDYRGVWIERNIPANAPQGNVVIPFVCEIDSN